MKDAIDRLMDEDTYRIACGIVGSIDGHPWSRRITRSDSDMVSQIRAAMIILRNDLFEIREALK